MKYTTSQLCDYFSNTVDVAEPLFNDYGARKSFYGIITTIKCFENNGLIAEVLQENGVGRVLLIDAGGSKRRAVLDRQLAELACRNNWEGIVCYGSVRDVEFLATLDLGIKAMASIPVLADDYKDGDVDLPVNFAGVTFMPEDYLYADLTGIVISPDELVLDEA